MPGNSVHSPHTPKYEKSIISNGLYSIKREESLAYASSARSSTAAGSPAEFLRVPQGTRPEVSDSEEEVPDSEPEREAKLGEDGSQSVKCPSCLYRFTM
jgi:hypothetical protein